MAAERGGKAVTNAIYNYLGIGNETVDARGREGERERSSSALCLPHSELFGSALRSWESYDGEILNVGDITIYAEGTKFCSKNEVS